MIRVLQEHLVSPRHLKLLDLERHAPDPLSSMLKPESVVAQIAIQRVLLAVALEKFSLGQEIVVSFHFVLNIDVVLVLHEFVWTVASLCRVLVEAFGHVWGHTDEILVRFGLFHLLGRLTDVWLRLLPARLDGTGLFLLTLSLCRLVRDRLRDVASLDLQIVGDFFLCLGLVCLILHGL